MKLNKIFIADDFNYQRLYVVSKIEDGIYFIERVKISKDVSVDRIREIRKKYEEGQVWKKTGNKLECNIKYAGKDINPNLIKGIIKVNTFKDKSKVEYDPQLNVEKQIEALTKENQSELERLMNDLEESFSEEAVTAKATKSNISSKTKESPRAEPKLAVSEPSKKRSKKTDTSNRTETNKKLEKELEEERNLAYRKRKHENEEISVEMDQKFTEKLKKDIKSQESARS